MPARDIRLEQRRNVAVSIEQIMIRNDAVIGSRQVDVRIKAGIEERDRYTLTRKTIISIQSERRRQDVRAVLVERGIRYDLVFGTCKQSRATAANFHQVF